MNSKHKQRRRYCPVVRNIYSQRLTLMKNKIFLSLKIFCFAGCLLASGSDLEEASFDYGLARKIVDYDDQRYGERLRSENSPKAELIEAFYADPRFLEDFKVPKDLDAPREKAMEIMLAALRYYSTGDSRFLDEQRGFPPFRAIWTYPTTSVDAELEEERLGLISCLDHAWKVFETVTGELPKADQAELREGMIDVAMGSLRLVSLNAKKLNDNELLICFLILEQWKGFVSENSGSSAERSQVEEFLFLVKLEARSRLREGYFNNEPLVPTWESNDEGVAEIVKHVIQNPSSDLPGGLVAGNIFKFILNEE